MRILVAEDDRTSRCLMDVTVRKWGHDVVLAVDGEEALATLRREDGPKLALLDWMMPGLDGLEVSRRIRATTGGEYIYIILVTAKSRKQDMLDGLEAGADDYVTKPVDSRELRVRLGAAERILNLQSELIAARESLREQATHDSLTRLWNRRAILDILSREVSRSAREDTSIGVIMADVDHFKAVNDTYGHKVGDHVLVEMAQRLHVALRPYDMVGRYGGEEFLMIVPRCDATFAAYVANRLRTAVAADPFRADGHELAVTASFGVAAARGLLDPSGQSLIQAADGALYAAKNDGRNKVCAAESIVPSLRMQLA